MIELKKIIQVRKALEESQNPLFFFDNDVDGFCAFLILRRAIDRGRGIPIKTFPDLKEQYLKKVDELNPDCVVVLDKAEAELSFLEGLNSRNIPIVWIDHHESKTKEIIDKHTTYVNSLPEAEPTSYIAQRVFERKEDLWLAMIGCTGDVYRPDFAEEFEGISPELYNSKLEPLDALNKTEIGKMARMINFGLMDSTTNVVKLIKYLFKAKNSYDLIEENSETRQFHKRYSELNLFFNKQIEKAEKDFDKKEKVLFHTYSGETSMSSQIANRLFFLHQDKLVVVGFKRPDKVNISIRGKNALKITLEAIKNLDGATGGGHEVATGAMVSLDDWEKFKDKLIKELE